MSLCFVAFQMKYITKDEPIDEMPSCVHLTQGNLVVIFVIQYIHQIRVEWMYFLWKIWNQQTFFCFSMNLLFDFPLSMLNVFTKTNLHFWKLRENLGQFVMQRLLHEFDFASIESADSTNRILSAILLVKTSSLDRNFFY